jgi:integrase
MSTAPPKLSIVPARRAGRRPGPAAARRNVTAEWAAGIGPWLAWLTAGAARPETLNLRRYQIERLAAAFPDRSPWAVGPDDLAGWIASHRWSLESIRSHRSAVRSFYGWAHASGLIEADPARLLRKVPAAAAKPRPAPEEVVDRALAAADGRVYLMLMLGARHGLRRGEIAEIHSEDLIPGIGGWSLLVHGKGGKTRVVPLLPDVARALRERPAGWTFPNRGGGHLTAGHVGKLISATMPRGVTPHQLRHRFASRAYQGSGDIRAVQELLGHASVATTQRYTAIANDALRVTLDAASRIG